ncbi:MAG TPA: DegT/DnrJ/EryC1/StrS family aminotransferase, partial [Thermoguttaceae bacterium]|nr:DegT/DnrJ/EryC1/StrS family aminotransferase [Thermoguttaceae bacterium]
QAAVLNVKLPHLDRYSTLRQANAQRYQQMFTEAGLDQQLQLPQAGPQMRHVWNQYVIRVPDGQRDALRAFLAEAKIGAEIYYPLGLHQQECFQYLQYAPDALPQTLLASEEVLALPIFPELTEDEQARVVDRIGAFMQKSTGGHALAGPKFLRHPAMDQKKATDG